MALIDRMVGLQARLTDIPVRLGVPQYRDLLIRHATLGPDLLKSHTDTLLQPKPKITNVPTRLVGLDIGGGGAFQGGGGITIAQDDFQVTGIPRSYSQSFLEKDVQYYVIDPAIVAGAVQYDSKGNPAAGIFCKLLTLRDKDLLTWSAILRRVKDHYSGNGTAEVNW